MPESSVRLHIQRLPHAPADLPAYQSDHAAGMDLRLAGVPVVLQPGERTLLPTGFCIAIPEGFEGQIRLRSGFALRTGLLLINAPGTIDADYRGELKILVFNPGTESIHIESGERVAQLVISPVARGTWTEVAELPPSTRDVGGFGSTGRS
jgi:dUTP pyrophosphatase